MPRFAIDLDLVGRSVLVVGLGAVGRRRAEALAACGAVVLAVDPGAVLPVEGVRLAREPYRREHLRGAALAVAAATSEVNRRVVADARADGVWVNSASEPGAGDFLVPASWRDGPIRLSVSTSGASPALSAALRDRAAGAIGPGAARLAAVLIELRAEVLATIDDPARRRAIFAAWADPRWLAMAERAEPDVLRAALRKAMDPA